MKNFKFQFRRGRQIKNYFLKISKWQRTLFVLFLFIYGFYPSKIYSQGGLDYFPMEVGNKWVFIGANTDGNSCFYVTGFEVQDKKIINDTIYYVIKSGFFRNMFGDSTLFRKDSTGCIFVRSSNKDQLLFNIRNPDILNPVSIDGGAVKVYYGWFLLKESHVSGSCYNYSGIPFRVKAFGYYTDIRLGNGIGPTQYSINNCINFSSLYIRQFINKNEQRLPTTNKILSAEYTSVYGPYQIYITVDNDFAANQKVVIISKKLGKMEGEFVPRLTSYYCSGNPGYFIKSEKEFVSNDQITVIFSGDLTDYFGYKLDGNDNCLSEGSPADDYKFTFTTPNLTRVETSEEINCFKLYQNYPNPFNPSTTINYNVPKRTLVELKIYDLMGREIDKPLYEIKEPGYYTLKWIPKNLTSGIYYYQLKAGNYLASRKLLYLR